VNAMCITIHGTFLPPDDPDASLARRPIALMVASTSGVTTTGSSAEGIETVPHSVPDLTTAKEVVGNG
jgi:hypothetical protein